MKYQIGEIFCGAGGIVLGANECQYKNATYAHSFLIDYNQDAIDTLHLNNIQADQILCADVRECKFTEPHKIDLLCFGFPCNDFSVAGERKGLSGKFGPLYLEGVRAINKLKPKCFLAENVSGLKQHPKAYQQIIQDLKQTGYRVSEKIYKFNEFGVPQIRQRIILIGIRSDVQMHFQHPEPTGLFATDTYPVITAAEALDRIPSWATHQEVVKHSDRKVEIIKHLRPGDTVQQGCAYFPRHLNVKPHFRSNQEKKLRPDKPSPTVDATSSKLYHWNQNRTLTNREYARIQTFPDTYNFVGSKKSVKSQIGMAVPPKGAKVILQRLLETLVQNNITPSEMEHPHAQQTNRSQAPDQ